VLVPSKPRRERNCCSIPGVNQSLPPPLKRWRCSSCRCLQTDARALSLMMMMRASFARRLVAAATAARASAAARDAGCSTALLNNALVSSSSLTQRRALSTAGYFDAMVGFTS
jgi:hypothetical protein